MVQRIVISSRHGGFDLSQAALKRLIELGCKCIKTWDRDYVFHPKGSYYEHPDIERDDPLLIQVVEELGEDANGSYARLKIVEIPDGVKWDIEEYDGSEWVAEVHRTWHAEYDIL